MIIILLDAALTLGVAYFAYQWGAHRGYMRFAGEYLDRKPLA